jgi:hypothetical protein
MAHPNLEELTAKLRAAREAGREQRGSPEQLRLHRELARQCPSFTPNLVELARALQLAEEPGVGAEEAFGEIHRLLEGAVEGSDRGAPEVVELGYFLDALLDQPHEAAKLFEEGAAKALGTLEDAWAGLLRYWTLERTRETLEKALRLGLLAEQVFPASARIQGAVDDARRYAAQEGVALPGKA